MTSELAFIIGNGPSRNEHDLHELQRRGTTYGCNALYRDFAPDYLIAVDLPMITEIITSGYAKEHVCYFPDWEPIAVADSLLDPTIGIKENCENAGLGFAEHGDKVNAEAWVLYGFVAMTSLLWVPPAQQIRSMQSLAPGQGNNEALYARFGTGNEHEFGAPAGFWAAYVAALNGHKRLRLIGFDGLLNDNFNNIYWGTPHYEYAKLPSPIWNPETKTYRPKWADGWPNALTRLKQKFPDIELKYNAEE